MSFLGSDKKPKHQHPSENHYGIWQIDIKYLCWIINAFWVRFKSFSACYLFSRCSLNLQRIRYCVLSRKVSNFNAWRIEFYIAFDLRVWKLVIFLRKEIKPTFYVDLVKRHDIHLPLLRRHLKTLKINSGSSKICNEKL